MCKCRPEICPQGFYWSERACSCLCLQPDLGCGEDSTWDDKNCKCVCLEPQANPCATDFYWENECCECFCAPIAENAIIPPGKQWDTRSCSFICIQQECAAGEYLKNNTWWLQLRLPSLRVQWGPFLEPFDLLLRMRGPVLPYEQILGLCFLLMQVRGKRRKLRPW